MTENAFSEPSFPEQGRIIKLLLLDVDGVLTDGRLFFSENGEEIKAFNSQDGHGIKMLQRSGVQVGIITGRTSTLVARRASDLGVTLLMQGREDKYQAMQELLEKNTLSLEEIAFIGDDYPDLAVMTRVGLGIAVANAVDAVIEHAHWQTRKRGGNGAVREVCDALMIQQGTYQTALASYLEGDA